LRIVCLSTVLALAATCAGAAAQPTVEAGVGLYSKYIWRGFDLVDEPVVQPSLTVTEGSLSLGLWANYDIGDELTELDYTVAHALPVGAYEGVVGYTYYTFPNVDEGGKSQEVFAGVRRPGRVPVSLTAYHDWDEGDGLYVELATEIALPARTGGGSVAAALGYNDHQWRDGSGLSHALLSYTQSTSVGAVSVCPTVAYSVALDDEFENYFYYGFAGGYAF